jgi:hypothetical protein
VLVKKAKNILRYPTGACLSAARRLGLVAVCRGNHGCRTPDIRCRARSVSAEYRCQGRYREVGFIGAGRLSAGHLGREFVWGAAAQRGGYRLGGTGAVAADIVGILD